MALAPPDIPDAVAENEGVVNTVLVSVTVSVMDQSVPGPVAVLARETTPFDAVALTKLPSAELIAEANADAKDVVLLPCPHETGEVVTLLTVAVTVPVSYVPPEFEPPVRAVPESVPVKSAPFETEKG